MSERWKPEVDNIYWIVDTCYHQGTRPMQWANDNIDNITYDRGNCFKTEAEAKAAAERVKALLLSLHEPATNSSQLPKLTAEVFDYPNCPEWAKWAAVDWDGVACYFANKPTLSQEATWW